MADQASSNGNNGGIADLLRRLADEASALLQGEIALAKLEMRQGAQIFARDSAKLGVALVLVWIGALALTAALVIGVAHLFGGRFGMAALAVGLTFVAIGGLLARSGMKRLAGGALKPTETIGTLEEGRDWARIELQQLRHELSRERSPAAELPASRARTLERTDQ